eukprot:jgi/Botrbrau1/11163/Bobra.182_2s0018.1
MLSQGGSRCIRCMTYWHPKVPTISALSYLDNLFSLRYSYLSAR